MSRERLQIGCGVLAFLLVSVAGGCQLLYEHRIRNAYKPTECIVVSRTKAERTETRDDDGQRVTHYLVIVSIGLRHRVDSVSYTWTDEATYERGSAEIEGRYAAFPPESWHTCWYDPQRPERAVLSNHPSSLGAVLLTAVGLLGTLIFGVSFRLFSGVRKIG
jgi:hypothetical protein